MTPMLSYTCSSALVAALVGLLPALAQPSLDVRQLVAFDFLPGQMAEAVRVFEDEALPLYRESPSMLRFRGFREVESPVPLDLVVMSSFDGMAGMDASNRELRAEAEKRGNSIGSIYGRIGASTRGHRDTFVEFDAGLGWGGRDAGPLVVMESLRLTPGASDRWDALLRSTVVPWEREAGIVSGGETGRYLVADGFDVLRIFSVASLGDWHRHVAARNEAAFRRELEGLVAASRQVIVSPVEELSVR